MKLLSTKPFTMKAPGQPNFYFSAYPLKAIGEKETEKKSYLHIITKPKNKKKYAGSLKVLPMVNPYTEKDEIRLSQQIKPNHPDNMEERDSDWFASYE